MKMKRPLVDQINFLDILHETFSTQQSTSLGENNDTRSNQEELASVIPGTISTRSKRSLHPNGTGRNFERGNRTSPVSHPTDSATQSTVTKDGSRGDRTPDLPQGFERASSGLQTEAESLDLTQVETMAQLALNASPRALDYALGSTRYNHEQASVAISDFIRNASQEQFSKWNEWIDAAGDWAALNTPEPLSPALENYSYRENPTPSGKSKRIQANIAAIKLLKKLEEENRYPEPKEKSVLSQYNGWGADKEIFNDSYIEYRNYPKETLKYNTDYNSWEKNYGRSHDQLRELLTEEEWAAARRSTLNAHYTSGEICHALWDIAKRIGFSGGTVLEPAMGVGHIIGAMPEEFREKTRVIGVELDSVSARLAAKLYPQADVKKGALEEQGLTISANSVDLVISNVPFSEVKPAEQNDPVKFNLHNYFINESLTKLRPGGLAVIITSASTMENNVEQRKAIANRSEFIGAIRLPNDAFSSNASTQVVTDILVLRKPDGQEIKAENWTSVLTADVDAKQAADSGKTTVTINEYFASHPQMVLGEHSLKGKMYGYKHNGQYTVFSPDGAAPIKERLDDAIFDLPRNIPNSTKQLSDLLKHEPKEAKRLYALLEDKPGNFVIGEDNNLYQVTTSRELASPLWRPTAEEFKERVQSYIPLIRERANLVYWLESETRERNESILVNRAVSKGLKTKAVKLEDKVNDALNFLANEEAKQDTKLPRGITPQDADEMIRTYVLLRDKLKEQMAVDLNPLSTEINSDSVRQELRKFYHNFTSRWGDLSNSPLSKLAKSDPELGLVLALELVREEIGQDNKPKQIVSQAPILNQRTLFPTVIPDHADTLEEAYTASIALKGSPQADFMAQLLGISDVESVRERVIQEGLAFLNPASGQFETKEMYLSGNVVQKHREAKRAATTDARYLRNVEALEDKLPLRVPLKDIRSPLGAAWIPANLIDQFAYDVFAQKDDFHVSYLKTLDQWVTPESYYHTVQVKDTYGTPEMDGIKILRHALNQQRIKITKKNDKITEIDEKASDQANARAQAISEAWTNWINEKPDIQQQIEEVFNNQFNNVIPPEYKGEHLKFPGLSTGPGSLQPREHQKDVTWRCLSEQSGLICHEVGFGKTLSLILTAMESKRMGLASKPMIVCDNASYPQFVATIRQCYPSASILVADDDSMNARNRSTFLSRAATGAWDFVVVPRSQFDLIPNSPQTVAKYIAEELEDLREAKESLDKDSGQRTQVRRIEKAIESAEQRLKVYQQQMAKRQDNTVCWEQLGVDLLLVDEAHNYKKSGLVTKFSNVKGLDATKSQRGQNLLMKARTIQEKRDGKGVILATATPVTNTMAEAWNMVRLCSPKTLEHYGVTRFDEFATAFCQIVSGIELNEANGKWREISRMSKFINGPSFINMLRAAMDVKLSRDNINLAVPNLKDGKIEMKVAALTEETAYLMDKISDTYQAYEEFSNKRAVSHVPITLMQVGMAASIDPRLVDSSLPDNKGSIVNQMCDEIVTIYKKTQEKQSTQVVFLDRYNVMNTSVLNTFSKPTESVEYESVETKDENAKSSIDSEEEAWKKDEPVFVKGFNLYSDIKEKLKARGVPEGEIAVATDYNNKEDRLKLFDAVNRGDVRVVIGSTTRLGTGVNMQKKLVAAHHLDPARDMTPASMTQRNGRIIRNGNENEEVRVIYYGMQDTMCPGVYDRISRKDKFIAQAMSGKGVGVEFEDAGEVRLEEMKAALISDKRQFLRAELIVKIKDEKLQREVLQGRERNLRASLDRETGRQNDLSKFSIPNAIKRAEWFDKNVKPIGKVVTVEIDETFRLKLSKLGVNLSPKMEDEFQTVKNIINKALTAMRDAPMDSSAIADNYGSITLNGLTIKIRKELTVVSSRDMAIDSMLIASVPDPEGILSSPISVTRFNTAEGLYKIVSMRSEEMAQEPEKLQGILDRCIKDIEVIKKQMANHKPFDDTVLTTAEKGLAELELDMKKNPATRRRSQRAQREDAVKHAAKIQINSTEIIQEQEELVTITA